jgi:sucrose phosphorylase
VWYLDLFAGKNDYEAMERAGVGGHKEINRTNLSGAQIAEKLDEDVVQKQIELLRFRNTFPAFGFDSQFAVEVSGTCLKMSWRKDGYEAVLDADMDTCEYKISGRTPEGIFAVS